MDREYSISHKRLVSMVRHNVSEYISTNEQSRYENQFRQSHPEIRQIDRPIISPFFVNNQQHNFLGIFGNLFNIINNGQNIDVPLPLAREDFAKLINLQFKELKEGVTNKHETFANVKDILDECTICTCNYEDTDQLILLPCGHYYHKDCIGRWLKEYDYTCPVCKQPCGSSAPVI